MTSSVPPVRLVASPRAETATSIRLPLRAKAGSSAVTITAAMFLVCELRHLVAGVDAQPLQHADQRFAGEHGVVQLVAGVVQPDHQAVADQLVLADALDVGDVLDADLGRGRQRGGERQSAGPAGG